MENETITIERILQLIVNGKYGATEYSHFPRVTDEEYSLGIHQKASLGVYLFVSYAKNNSRCRNGIVARITIFPTCVEMGKIVAAIRCKHPEFANRYALFKQDYLASISGRVNINQGESNV